MGDFIISQEKLLCKRFYKIVKISSIIYFLLNNRITRPRVKASAKAINDKKRPIL